MTKCLHPIPAGAGINFFLSYQFPLTKTTRLIISLRTLGEHTMALTIVSVDKQGNNELHVTVQGDNPEEVTSVAAKRLAYDERSKHGFDNGGIESIGGSYPVDKRALRDGAKAENAVLQTSEDMKEIGTRMSDLAYRHVYRINRGL